MKQVEVDGTMLSIVNIMELVKPQETGKNLWKKGKPSEKTFSTCMEQG